MLRRRASIARESAGGTNLSPLRRKVRRTSTDYEKPLGPAKLYLDDLDDLVAELRKVVEEEREKALAPYVPSNSSSEEVKRLAQEARKSVEALHTVKIRVGGAEADEVEDLRSADSKDLRTVSIYSFDPTIRIYLTRSHATASVTAKAEEATLRALVDDIVEFVNRRRIFLIWRNSYAYIATFLLALFGLQSWVYWTDENRPNIQRYVLAGIYAAVALGNIIVFPIVSRRMGGVVIIPERRGESRGLTAQTRRDLVVALVGAIVGAILATIGGVLIK